MTVYNTTISSSPANSAGLVSTTISSERINDHNGGNFVSSEDFADKGVQVIDGKTGGRKSVYTAGDLDPSDIVRVEGIPMTVAQAKSAGYSFDGDEPIAADNAEKLAVDNDEGPPVDFRQEGEVTDAEVIAMDNVVSAVEMHTGLDQEATIELGKDILTGEISQDDVIWAGLQNRGISRDAALASVGQVVEVGQSAARRELGASDYNELSRLADSSAAIKNLVIGHGIKRMSGKAKGVTWKHVMTLARQFARG